MPCEDGQHVKYEPENEVGERKYCDFVLWKSTAKDKLIRIMLCKNCKLLYWDEVIETRVVKYIIDPNDLNTVGKREYAENVKKWNLTHSTKI